MKPESAKYVSFQANAPYFTQGQWTETTQHLWIVCHGYGQLAPHFLKRFDVLDPTQHYVIAPQGPDRFYMDNFQKVGASWTTRVDKAAHLQNQQAYLDQLFDAECRGNDLKTVQIHLLGFSQGVSVITRWAVRRRLPFQRMILWAGGFPRELIREQWDFMPPEAEVWLVAGEEDPYISAERRAEEHAFLKELFGEVQVLAFEGGHEMPREVLGELVG